MVDADRCVMCGAIIPEGRQVCPECEDTVHVKNMEFKSSLHIGDTVYIVDMYDDTWVVDPHEYVVCEILHVQNSSGIYISYKVKYEDENFAICLTVTENQCYNNYSIAKKWCEWQNQKHS